MKRLLALPIVVFVLIAVVRFAFAGPEPISGKEMKQVVPPPPECNWTGFYVGALAGYARGDMVWKDVDFGDNELMADHDQSGFLGGGELGFNYQWHWLVVGLEGSFVYSDLQGHSTSNFTGGANLFETRSDWQGNIGGRLGVAWNHLLFYAKGGATFNQQRYSWLESDPENELVNTFKTDETRVGGFVGGGVEYMINCRWSVKLEYDHSFLGTDTITGTRIDDQLPESESYDVKLNQDTVWFGVNYKFWNF